MPRTSDDIRKDFPELSPNRSYQAAPDVEQQRFSADEDAAEDEEEGEDEEEEEEGEEAEAEDEDFDSSSGDEEI
ncbi:MAG TPA: hypothetical protein VFH51_04805 [Myxococcota bacterium]|nr:hypothetical protein [Myxococcota bacterium]